MSTTQERQRWGRIGGYVSASQNDTRETTRKAREAAAARFSREVDPDGVLPEAERERRAECARKAWYAQIQEKSVKARRARKLAK